jgi:poly-gamma-glutamate capsule biosynthesis protein CapA/YwtB (metallophosphatase superfamily)
VTVLGSGDVLIHPQLWQQAARDARAEGRSGYDFGPIYAGIAADVRPADLAVCEMESPLAPPGGPFSGWPSFSSPPQVLTALKDIGYDSCTTASNHTYDQGSAGIRRTLDELDAAGLRHTGSARSAAEANKPLIIRMSNGVRVAQLAYTFNLNGLQLPSDEQWLANVTDIPRILAAAARAKRDGADLVVVSMHWGVEYDRRATALQRQQARELLASPDVDLVLGDHAHVVQPAQRIHGKWVLYCVGNQIARHADPVLVSREGAMPEFTFAEVHPGRFRVTAARVIPTLLQLGPPLRLIDLARAVRSPAVSPANRAEYRRDIAAIRRTLDAYGAGRDGLVVG